MHALVDRVLFGRVFWRVHRGMDWPYRFLGRRHRILLHDPVTAVVLARRVYPGDEDAAMAALMHIAVDRLCSSSPFFDQKLKLFAKAARKKRKKTRRRRAQSKRPLLPLEWERFLKELKKQVSMSWKALLMFS